MQRLRPLLHPVIWLIAAVSSAMATLVFLTAFLLPSYVLEDWLTASQFGQAASAIMDVVFYGIVLAIWTAGGFLAGHVSASYRLWRTDSATGYWWAGLAAIAVGAGFVAIDIAPIAAVGVVLGAYFGRRSGARAAIRNEAMRDAIEREVFEGRASN